MDMEEVKRAIMDGLEAFLQDCGYKITNRLRLDQQELYIQLDKVDIFIRLNMEENTSFPITEYWKYEENVGHNTLEYTNFDLADPDGLDKGYRGVADTIEKIEKRGPRAKRAKKAIDV